MCKFVSREVHLNLRACVRACVLDGGDWWRGGIYNRSERKVAVKAEADIERIEEEGFSLSWEFYPVIGCKCNHENHCRLHCRSVSKHF